MNTAIQLKVDDLNKMTVSTMVEDERVSAKFVQLYNAIHGVDKGEMIYHKEKFNFLRQVQEDPKLQQCSRLSLYGAFIDMAVNGMSVEQGSKPMAYLTTRSAKVGENQYEQRAYLTISPYGELVMRMRAGQILHADNPVIVYEGDTFEPEVLGNGQKQVHYKPSIPRKTNVIIGAFIRITRTDGTTDIQWMLQDDINRLKGYSEKNNRGAANALYTSNGGHIDPGFLEAKIIKHAFRSYPKVRTRGENTQVESQMEEEPINYGIKPDHEEPFAPHPQDQAEAETVVFNAEPEDTQAGF